MEALKRGGNVNAEMRKHRAGEGIGRGTALHEKSSF